jgi:hypothetical protein
MAKLFPNYSSYYRTSPFGVRIHPVTGARTMHNGIDLVASNGGGVATDYIAAFSGGTVEKAGYDSSAGNFVNIRTDAKTLMVYYHMRETPYVKTGQTIKEGTKIGYMGSTGASTGAHLHFGIKVNGSWVDPQPYLDKVYGASSASAKGGNTVSIEMNVLTKGSQGEQVKTLQRLLMALDYDMGKYGADGSFGGTTDQRVREYQKKMGLVVDGSVGQATWTKLLKG